MIGGRDIAAVHVCFPQNVATKLKRMPGFRAEI